MEYLALYNLLHTDGSLARQVEVACLVAAGTILAEPAGTPSHADRLAWAKAVLAAPAAEAAALRPLLLLDARIQDAGELVEDAVVQAVVDALVPTVSTGRAAS